jgi:hypothetical protein
MMASMKNAVFWNVTQSGFCKNRLFGGMYHLRHRGERIGALGTTLTVTGN